MSPCPVPYRDPTPHLDPGRGSPQPGEWSSLVPEEDPGGRKSSRQRLLHPFPAFPHPTPPGSLTPGVLLQSLSHFLDKVQNLSRDFKPLKAQNTIQVRAGPTGGQGGVGLAGGGVGGGSSADGDCP
jgi:hypothetical protein